MFDSACTHYCRLPCMLLFSCACECRRPGLFDIKPIDSFLNVGRWIQGTDVHVLCLHAVAVALGGSCNAYSSVFGNRIEVFRCRERAMQDVAMPGIRC